jgi:hypothetical protein
MSQHNSTSHDEDADYKLALQLSKELNGEQLPLKSAAEKEQADYNSDADFAYALELQFGDANKPYDDELHVTNAGPSRREAQFSDVSPWVPGTNEAKVATYHPETTGGKTFGTLTEFLSHLKSAQCPKCGWVFFRSASDVSTLFQNWVTGKGTYSFLRMPCGSLLNTMKPFSHRS